MIGCPDCGSLITYQHAPGCRLAVMSGKSKLYRRYPDYFLQRWKGCQHLDCLPRCSLEPAYCQRLDEAFAKWEAQQ